MPARARGEEDRAAPSRVVRWHGRWHAKTLLPRAWPEALAEGVRAASSLALKDSSGRTAVPLSDAERMAREHPRLADFAMVGDMLWRPDLSAPPLVPDPEHSPHVAFLPCTAHEARTGAPLGLDPQHILQRTLAWLFDAGYGLRVGIEVEFHVWSVAGPADPADQATWPGGAPTPNALGLLHPGYQLLSDRNAWVCQRLFDRIAAITAALGLPLASLDIEMGPSQFELVLEAQEAAHAARSLALLRGLLPALLAREGWFASFICRPPWDGVMASGWHVHHSWVDRESGRNAFAAAGGLSPLAGQVIAGELAQAAAMTTLAVPTLNGYERFRTAARSIGRPPASHPTPMDRRSHRMPLMRWPISARAHSSNAPLASPSSMPGLRSWRARSGGMPRRWSGRAMTRRAVPPAESGSGANTCSD